jgi:hypothetical protein
VVLCNVPQEVEEGDVLALLLVYGDIARVQFAPSRTDPMLRDCTVTFRDASSSAAAAAALAGFPAPTPTVSMDVDGPAGHYGRG